LKGFWTSTAFKQVISAKAGEPEVGGVNLVGTVGGPLDWTGNEGEKAAGGGEFFYEEIGNSLNVWNAGGEETSHSSVGEA